LAAGSMLALLGGATMPNRFYVALCNVRNVCSISMWCM